MPRHEVEWVEATFAGTLMTRGAEALLVTAGAIEPARGRGRSVRAHPIRRVYADGEGGGIRVSLRIGLNDDAG